MKIKLLKSKVIIAYILAAILGVGTTAIGASTAVPTGGTRMDSTFRVGNITQNVNYTDTVSARIDDVVRYELWYHNTELADSGKTADNLNVRVSLPTLNTTSHTATAVTGGSNTNTITNSATVNTNTATTLEYIPGTAYRRYNTGTNANPNWVTEGISDSVMTASGYTISRVNPCWNFQETITVQARVRGSVVSINKQVKIEGTENWVASVNANPGNTVAYLITIKNEGNTRLTDVMVRDTMPPRMDYIEGSARLTNSNFPNGISISDLLVQGGINAGNYAPGGVGYIRFTAMVPQVVDRCMDGYAFNNVAVVKPGGMGEYYNTARVTVNYPCGVTPPEDQTQTQTQNQIQYVSTSGKDSMPESGPAEAAAGALGLTATGGALMSWLKSKKALLSAITKIK